MRLFEQLENDTGAQKPVQLNKPFDSSHVQTFCTKTQRLHSERIGTLAVGKFLTRASPQLFNEGIS